MNEITRFLVSPLTRHSRERRHSEWDSCWSVIRGKNVMQKTREAHLTWFDGLWFWLNQLPDTWFTFLTWTKCEVRLRFTTWDRISDLREKTGGKCHIKLREAVVAQRMQRVKERGNERRREGGEEERTKAWKRERKRKAKMATLEAVLSHHPINSFSFFRNNSHYHDSYSS